MNAYLRSFFSRPSLKAFAVFTVLYTVALAVLFWGTWGLDRTFVQPDCPTYFGPDFMAHWLRDLLAGASFVPFDVRNAIGSPYFWQELQYAVPCYLAALGLAYYLRGRGVSLLAVYGAGAAYGLMGYNATLFSAGHLGWFVWLSYGPFVFGLIDRFVRSASLVHAVFLGAALAWASARQPDLWLLFAVLSFFYGLWCMGRERRWLCARLWLGLAVTALMLFVCGWPQLKRAIFTETANRDRQIAQSTGSSSRTAPQDAAKRWDFCTSWSLPPDETAELMFGARKGDSNDPRISPRNPYTGRIGQRFTVPEGQRLRDPASGRVLKPGEVVYMPYRQHGLYMGFLTCVLACAGIGGFVLRRRLRVPADVDIGFWSMAFMLSLVCAWGGFTPFYRLVYALPMGDYIRCPVKFVHLAEWCAAAAAGFGLHALAAGLSRRGWRAGATVLLWGLVLVNTIDLVRTDRRYVAVEDHTFYRRANAAADAVVAQGGGKVLLAVLPQEGAEAFARSFSTHRCEVTREEGADVRFVFATQQGLQAFPKVAARFREGSLAMAGAYQWQKEKGLYAVDQARASGVLLRIPEVPAPTPNAPVPVDFWSRFFTLLSLAGTTGVCVFGMWIVFRKGFAHAH